MESTERSTVKIVRKSHTMARYSSTTGGSSNGHKQSASHDSAFAGSSHRACTEPDISPIYDDEAEKGLESRGIRIVDTNVQNFSNVSPEQVSDYYKSLGDWQNVLPKTDYSYSPVSRFYKKKINGVIPVVPNMSRRFIWRNAERVDNEINAFRYQNLLHEERRLRQAAGVRHSTPNVPSSSSMSATSSVGRRFVHVLGNATKSVDTYTRRTYSKITRLFESHRREPKPGYVKSNFWKILLLALFGLLVYLVVAGAPPWFDRNAVDAGVSLVGTSFSKPLSFIFNLVFGIYELTYSSVTFLVSVISYSGRYAMDGASSASFAFLKKERHEEIRLASADKVEVERLVQLLLADNTAELVKKIVSSPELAAFVEAKLRRLREEGDQKLGKLAESFERRNTLFEKRLSELEERWSATNVVEETTLKERIEMVREEIRSREKRIEHEVVVLLGAAAGIEAGTADQLRDKFLSLFESVEMAHLKIENLNVEFRRYTQNATESFESTFERSKDELKHDLKDDLRMSVEEIVTRKLGEWRKEAMAITSETRMNADHFQHLEQYVRKVVKDALDKYDADKTGLADYALESSGGTILSTRCTETKATNGQFSIFGIPLWHTSRSPRTVIQPGVHPGECWAFPGSTGYLVIQLAERITVTGFTVEHIPRALAPNGTIDSAPKDFSVWALRWEVDAEPKLLGKFQFDVNGPSLQYFEANKLDEPYQIVELKILSNHGKIDYTCLYRFRVHGRPA